jgi:catechol 2,3-dioxygenase-like lactoylglutathione lyase family enzyme
MLGDKKMWATLPTEDPELAADFYSKRLGLKLVNQDEYGVSLQTENGQGVFLYKKGLATADNTALSFEVDNIEKEMEELRDNGIEFEEYEMEEEGIVTENGVAMMGETKAAWFTDPDGNIIALTEGM